MKLLGLTLITLGLAFAALPAAAQETSYRIVAYTEGSGGYFTIEGQTERNPTLNVPAGEQITVTVVAGDSNGAHNFCVGSDCSDLVADEGQTADLTFTAPASGTVEYYCQPHRAAGMVGTLSVGGGDTPTPTGNGATPTGNTATPTGNGGTDGGNDSPGIATVGIVIAALGAALVIGRRKA